MMPESRCFICSANIAGCDHEILRWSALAGEFEDSALRRGIRSLERRIGLIIVAALKRGNPPTNPDLLGLSRIALEVTGEGDNEDLQANIDGAVRSYVLQVLENLSGVSTSREWNGLDDLNEEPTLVFWAEEPERVEQALEDRVRELEFADVQSRLTEQT